MVIHGFWSDKAIIQQKKPIRIQGITDAGCVVVAYLKDSGSGDIILEGKTISSSNGDFVILLPQISASQTKYDLEIIANAEKNKQIIIFKQLLAGEIWLLAGQSNMAFSTKNSVQKDKILKGIENTSISFFNVPGFDENLNEYTKRPLDSLQRFNDQGDQGDGS